MRKTKIRETIKEMCLAGMNVARLNFSHGTHQEHKTKIDTIKEVREELNLPIAIMLDTKGPEYRIKTFKNGKVYLEYYDSSPPPQLPTCLNHCTYSVV